MTRRIDFPAEGVDPILFENKLLEKGINYAKFDGYRYRFSATVSFLVDEKDYAEASLMADAFQSRLHPQYIFLNFNNSGWKTPKYFFLIFITVFLISLLLIQIYK